MTPRRIALVCVTPRPDADELVSLQMPSYGIRRIQAAIVGDPTNPGHVVELIDFGRDDMAAYVERILDFEPDLIGVSIYVWSMSCLIAVAREIKRRRPGCAIVFGGPSARTALFDLEPYKRPGEFLDAIVEGDGEFVFREIAALGDLSYESIRLVPGVTAPSNSGWLAAAARPAGFDLDLLPSPYHLGMMEPRQVAYLETYRGCPMSCRFCEWGASSKSRSMFSAQYIANEIGQFERHASSAVFLLDAGLNLNLRAFHNLQEANRRTGYLRKTLFWARDLSLGHSRRASQVSRRDRPRISRGRHAVDGSDGARVAAEAVGFEAFRASGSQSCAVDHHRIADYRRLARGFARRLSSHTGLCALFTGKRARVSLPRSAGRPDDARLARLEHGVRPQRPFDDIVYGMEFGRAGRDAR